MFLLGMMYANGQGVTQDHREEVKWYRKAADKGVTKAMFNLGVMYASGDGVTQDYAKSYVWCSVAAAFGDKKARELRDLVAKQLTAKARLAAQRIASKRYKEIAWQMND